MARPVGLRSAIPKSTSAAPVAGATVAGRSYCGPARLAQLPSRPAKMAYRAHLIVLDLASGRPLTLTALRRDEAARSGRLGHVGTRHGLPGIWIETEQVANFLASLERVC